MTTARPPQRPASRGRAPVRQLPLKLALFVLLCALPVYGSGVRQGMLIPGVPCSE